jgi:hypothetical protein
LAAHQVARQTKETEMMPDNQLKRYLSVAVLMLLALPAGASVAFATADGCAVVLQTPDGFLNLRESPSAKSRIVAELSRGDFLEVDTAQCEEIKGRSICSGKTGWSHVLQVRRFGGKPHHGSHSGWASDKYVQWFPCPD